MEALSTSPYVREFRFICVDAPPGGTRPALPPYVRAVPTLMIAGESEPRTDGRVMGWLMERRMRDREAVAAPGLGVRMGAPAAGGAGAAASTLASVGPAAFSSDMVGFGDEGYSFIGEDATADKGATSRMIGNMASLNEIHMLSMSDSRATAPFMMMGGGAGAAAGAASAGAGAGAAKQSEKSKALDDAYARMLAEREASAPGPKPPMNPFTGGR